MSSNSWKKNIGLVCLLAVGVGLFMIWYLSIYPGNRVPMAVSFAILYVAIFGLMQIPGIGTTWESLTDRFSRLLTRRNLFVADPETEAPKLSLIRIIFGMFLVQRAYYILLYAFPEDLASTVVFATMVLNLIAGLMIMFGSLTQLGLLYLIFIQWHHGDSYLGTSTLGNDIGAMLAFLMLLTSAGAHLSMDGRWMRQDGWLGKLVSLGYAENGLPKASSIQLAKFVAITSYWLVCCFSLATHIREDAWVTGVAGPFVLTNNFMMRHYDVFAAILTDNSFATWAANASIWLMMLWYSMIVPFVIAGGWFRKYIVIWGLLFFSLSTFLLNLGWLGIFEFIMWAALFWTGIFINRQGSFLVAYDDKCNLCDRTVNVVKFVDIFKVVRLIPASKNKEWLEKQGVSYDEAMKDLYGFEADSESRFAGYDFYLELSKRVLLLFPFFPILWLGRVLKLGPKIYRVVAEYRVRIAGVCMLPTPKTEYDYSSSGRRWAPASARFALPALLLHFLIAASIFAIYTPYPFFSKVRAEFSQHAPEIQHYGKRFAHFYGVAPINVFNSVDLQMAEHWFTITAIDKDGNRQLLPILDVDGSRLEWHKSDRVYFGNTLRYRRKARQLGPTCYRDADATMLRRFMSLYERKVDVPPRRYVVDYYYQPLADPEKVAAGHFRLERVKQVCRLHVRYSGAVLRFDPGELNFVGKSEELVEEIRAEAKDE